MNKLGAFFLAAILITLVIVMPFFSTSSSGSVGISMPTQSLQRWNQDGANMKSMLEKAGYEVNLQYANNDVAVQVAQIENMLVCGAKVLIVAPIDGGVLDIVLGMAKKAGVPVISYDRLITGTSNIDYYVTFDNYGVGVIQGEFIVDKFDLENTDKTYTIEFTAGSPDDNNAGLFFAGAFDTLKPYMDAGKLICLSGQTEFDTAATPAWKTETAQARMENILTGFYPDCLTGGTKLDICLCSNDTTALGVTNSLVNFGFTAENMPVITGQDCEISNVKNMLKGQQAMSVFKDTRLLAAQTVEMVSDILANKEPKTNATYNNGVMDVPSYNCPPEFADINNYYKVLVESGYYTEEQLAQ